MDSSINLLLVNVDPGGRLGQEPELALEVEPELEVWLMVGIKIQYRLLLVHSPP